MNTILSKEALEGLCDRISDGLVRNGAHAYGVRVWQDGRLASRTLVPTAGVLNCYSVTKNFIATGIGMLTDAGKLSPDAPVLSFFENEIPEGMPAGYERVKIRHLLSQTTGISQGFLFEEDRYLHGDDNWVRLSLRAPLVYEPGEFFCYSNTNYYLLTQILEKVSGKTPERFLGDTLFRPLKIETTAWEFCPMGKTIGATGLHLYLDDMMKLGIVYLENGAKLVSPEWVREATRDHVNRRGQARYGYSFWLKRDGYEFNGKHGQIIEIYPNRGLVIASQAAVGCNLRRVADEALNAL